VSSQTDLFRHEGMLSALAIKSSENCDG